MNVALADSVLDARLHMLKIKNITMRQCILSFIAFTFIILFTMGGYAGGQPKKALAGDLPPNSWITLDLTEAFEEMGNRERRHGRFVQRLLPV